MTIPAYVATLAELKAAPISDETIIYDGSLFKWTPNPLPGPIDNANIVKKTGSSAGGWVRQRAETIPFRRPEANAVTRTVYAKAAEQPSVADWGAYPDNTDRGPALQRALDECPRGASLLFPAPETPDFRYITSQPLVMRRKINIKADGALLFGQFAATDTTSDLLTIDITDPDLAPPLNFDRDARGMQIEGFRSISLTNGRHALRMTVSSGNALTNLVLRNIRALGVADSSAGYALLIDGVRQDPNREPPQHNEFENCFFENGVYVAGTDGNKFHACKFGGVRTGAILDLVPGAFQTTFRDCLFTNRDGGVIIGNGDFILVDNCHFEQAVSSGWPTSENQQTYGSQLLIYGQNAALPCRNIRIQNTNFGGGTNCKAPVTLVGNTSDVLFGAGNQWRVGSTGYDLRILTNSCKGTVIDPIQYPNGVRPGVDAGNPLGVYDLGTATRGHRKPGSVLPFENGWSAGSNMTIETDRAGRVLIGGSMISGTPNYGTRIFTVPVGYRPRVEQLLAFANGADTSVVKLLMNAAGEVTIAGPCPPSGTSIYLTATYQAQVRDAYEPGA